MWALPNLSINNHSCFMELSCTLGNLGSWFFLVVSSKKKFSNFLELVQFVIEEGKHLEHFAMLVWTIWYLQNQIRIKHVEFPASQVLSQASQMPHEFYRVQPALPSRPPSWTQTWVHWQPPPDSVLKVNFNGATFRDVNMAGLGVVVCDSKGQVLASLC